MSVRPWPLLAEVKSPDGEAARFLMEVNRAVEPQAVPMVAEQISTLTATTMPEAIPVVAAAYLSAHTRELLDDSGVGYIGTTGNVNIASSAPGLFVLTQGADSDPWPQDVDLSTC